MKQTRSETDSSISAVSAPHSNNRTEPRCNTAIREDYLEGAPAIAAFLGQDWTERRIYRARDTGALPIRRRAGIGIYAFRSELVAALTDPKTLPGLTAASS